MGKKSREKKERKNNQGQNASSMIKNVRRKSSLIAMRREDGSISYFNPMKKLMQQRAYSSEEGKQALIQTMNRWAPTFNQATNELVTSEENTENTENTENINEKGE